MVRNGVVPGRSLTTYCDEHRLGIEERLRLFLDLCEAIQHAHHRGILHRDLKPANILVSETEGRPLVKVIDFGLAKATDQRLVEHTLMTEQGQILGTPEYMSPEQTDPDVQDVDVRTDVYSLGAVLYELLTGSVPLARTGTSPSAMLELLQRVRTAEPAKPSSYVARHESREVAAARGFDAPARLARRLRGDLDWIVLRALAKDREQRYQSPLDLARDLQSHLAHLPVTAGPPSAWYRLKKGLRRHRVAAGVVAIVSITLLVATITSTTFWIDSQRSLGYFDQLGDLERSRALLQQAELELWPMHEDRVSDMERWLAEARSVAARLPRIDADIADVERRHGERLQSIEGGWSFDQYRFTHLHEALALLRTNLRELSPAIPDVESRIAWARSLRRRSIDDHAEEWARAIASIASRAECPRYGGLRIVPQLGLVPLRRNPETGLWEFLHVDPRTAPPEPDPDQLCNWRLGPTSGLVLVLLPGGTFVQGAQSKDPAAPNYDPAAAEMEGPPQRVSLDAFFIAKYETTQGQWLLVNGSNPSLYAPDYNSKPGRHLHETIDLTHPVEQVSWNDAELCARRMGLCLPTESQWEYAARAETTTPWWTGATSASLRGKVNLADQIAVRSGVASIGEDWEDGREIHAPVASYAANGFGLYHVLGNVFEWVQDPNVAYDEATPRSGDGLRSSTTDHNRIARGGGWTNTAGNLRCARRLQYAPGTRSAGVGFRLACPLLLDSR